jgi:hypothetical protein
MLKQLESEEIINHPTIKLRNLLIETYETDINRLLGWIYTIIDAAISDIKQREALKDLIRNTSWERMGYNTDMRQIIYEFVEKYCMNTEAELNSSILEKSMFGEIPASTKNRYKLGYFSNLPVLRSSGEKI